MTRMYIDNWYFFQTYLSYKMVPAVNGKIVVFIRAGLSVLTLILTITTIIPGYISMLEFQGEISRYIFTMKTIWTTDSIFSQCDWTGNDYKKWLPTDGGWGWHVASAISEWVLAIVYCCFLLTFVPEFRLINFEDPVVTVRRIPT